MAWQIHSPWSLTWPMFSWSLEISMWYSSVLMTICWIIWKTDMWPLMTVFETRTFLSTQWWPLRYFARSCSAIFPRIPEQRVDRTMRQSDSLIAVCIDSYFKVDTWIVPGCDDGRQQVGMPSFKFSYCTYDAGNFEWSSCSLMVFFCTCTWSELGIKYLYFHLIVFVSAWTWICT